MRINATNLAMIRGDTESITLSCSDKYGTFVPLVVGDTIYFTVKKTINDESKIMQRVITEFPDGKAFIEITPSDTKTLPYGDYLYDIQLVKSSGVVSTIITPSVFSVLGEITYE